MVFGSPPRTRGFPQTSLNKRASSTSPKRPGHGFSSGNPTGAGAAASVGGAHSGTRELLFYQPNNVTESFKQTKKLAFNNSFFNPQDPSSPSWRIYIERETPTQKYFKKKKDSENLNKDFVEMLGTKAQESQKYTQRLDETKRIVSPEREQRDQENQHYQNLMSQSFLVNQQYQQLHNTTTTNNNNNNSSSGGGSNNNIISSSSSNSHSSSLQKRYSFSDIHPKTKSLDSSNNNSNGSGNNNNNNNNNNNVTPRKLSIVTISKPFSSAQDSVGDSDPSLIDRMSPGSKRRFSNSSSLFGESSSGAASGPSHQPQPHPLPASPQYSNSNRVPTPLYIKLNDSSPTNTWKRSPREVQVQSSAVAATSYSGTKKLTPIEMQKNASSSLSLSLPPLLLMVR